MDLCVYFSLQKEMGQSKIVLFSGTVDSFPSTFSLFCPCLEGMEAMRMLAFLFCACTKYWWEHNTHSPYLGSDPKYFGAATKQFCGVKFYLSFKWLSAWLSSRYWNIISQISSLTHSGLEHIQIINFLFLKSCSSFIFHHQLGVL